MHESYALDVLVKLKYKVKNSEEEEALTVAIRKIREELEGKMKEAS